jgi:hypothetical protein
MSDLKKVRIEYVDGEAKDQMSEVHWKLIDVLTERIPEIVKVMYWVAEMNKVHRDEYVSGILFYVDLDDEPLKLMVTPSGENQLSLDLNTVDGEILGFVHIPHFKTQGVEEFRRVTEAIKKIFEERERGDST